MLYNLHYVYIIKNYHEEDNLYYRSIIRIVF